MATAAPRKPTKKLQAFTPEHFRAYTSRIVLDNGEPWEVEDFQMEVVEPILAGVKEIWGVIPEGNGKLEPLSSVLPTPTGQTTMGDVKIGDRLLGSDGKPTIVTYVTPVQIGKDCYRVTFSDGAERIVGAEHLWWVEDAQDHYRGSVRSTEYLASKPLKLAKKGKDGRSTVARWRVPTAARRCGPLVHLAVDPYTLGAWLADGDRDSGLITSPDQGVWTRIVAAGYQLGKPCRQRGAFRMTVLGLVTGLRRAGVLGNKHIPTDYLLAPEADRWALLQGLVDSDGTVSKAGQVTYSSSRKALADDVRRLVWSLGLPCSMNEDRAMLDSVDYGPTWDLTISCDRRHPVASLPRKVARLKKHAKTADHRRIVAIDRVPSVPAKCIQVDAADSLYLTGEAYIPTHNTTLMAGVALYHADFTPQPWVPVAASSRDQAEILAQQAYAMIRQTPGLLNRFRIYEGYRKITSLANHGRGIKVYAADANCLPVDEPVLTPAGWTAIGNLKVGDAICDPDGGRAVVEGVYPRGYEDVYRVTMADGSSVRATADHLWTVGISQRHPYWRTVSTAQIARYLALDEPLRRSTRWGTDAATRARATRVRLPTIAPQEFDPRGDLPLDPYFVGLLLGDGTLTRSPIRFTSRDRELFDSLDAVLPSGVYSSMDGAFEDPARAPSLSFASVKQQHGDGTFAQGSNPLTEAVRDAGLFGRTAHDKFIPQAYKWASVNDRLALLQGLMDSDGTVDHRGRASFCSVSRLLAEDLLFVVRSLGGRTSLRGPLRTSDQPCYRLDNIRLPGMSLFRLDRKKIRQVVRQDHARQWSVVSVEPEGRADVVCIKVSSPSSLYLTRDFIPTHNTGDGVIPTLALCDEGHRWPDLSLYRLWRGKLNKRGGQIVMISTAGEPGSEFEEMRDTIREKARKRKVVKAHIRSEGLHIVMNEWRVESEGDITNFEKVKDANPFSGITEVSLEEEFESPTTDLGDWRRLKPLAVDTPIPTPHGWRTMGDLAVGDQVLNADGLPTRVRATTPAQFDRDCYELTFSDGATITATDDHLWEVEDVARRHRVRILTTLELAKNLTAPDGRGRPFSRWRVRTVGRKTGVSDLPVDPYVLGVWLGDGTAKLPRITNGDPEVWAEIEARGYELGRIPPSRSERSRVQTLLGVTSVLAEISVLDNKHIPSCYLLAAETDRWELLQGLIDSDGSVSQDGRVLFANTNIRLATDVRQLAWSLGRPCMMREGRAMCEGVDHGPCYTLEIPCDSRHPVVRLSRKVTRLREGGRTCDYRRIRSVEPIDSVPVRCIAVDAKDSLFLAGTAMIPTHNCNIPSRTVQAAITEVEWSKARSNVYSMIPEGQHVDCGCDVAWKHDTFAITPLWRIDREVEISGAPESASSDDSTFQLRHEGGEFLLGRAEILTPPRDGSTLHPDEVKMAFQRINDVTPIDAVVIDIERAEDIAAWLEDDMGIEVIDRPQGNALAVEDYDAFMKGLRNGTLLHTGDDGLHRHAMNAIARHLPGDKRRFDRPSQSRAKKRQNVRVIDALTAAGMVNHYASQFVGAGQPMVAWR